MPSPAFLYSVASALLRKHRVIVRCGVRRCTKMGVVMAIDLREPEITRDDILLLPDRDFNLNNVCIVTGAGSGIGRATCLAAAANKLMVAGLDIGRGRR